MTPTHITPQLKYVQLFLNNTIPFWKVKIFGFLTTQPNSKQTLQTKGKILISVLFF